MSNRNLIILTLVLLAGVFLLVMIQTNRDAPNDSIGGSVNEVVEEVQDEIDDHTTSR